VFNILVSNHDDHVKNHGVIRSPGGHWRLSPAFDLLAGEGGSREMRLPPWWQIFKTGDNSLKNQV